MVVKFKNKLKIFSFFCKRLKEKSCKKEEEERRGEGGQREEVNIYTKKKC